MTSVPGRVVLDQVVAPKSYNRQSTPGSHGERGGHPSASEPPAKKSDVVLIHSTTPDGKGLQVFRKRDDLLEAGAVRPLEHGKPITGELVRLRPRPEFPLLCDVTTELEAGGFEGRDTAGRGELGSRPTSAGPAQVASARYRENWDRIWGPPPGKQLPN